MDMETRSNRSTSRGRLAITLLLPLLLVLGSVLLAVVPLGGAGLQAQPAALKVYVSPPVKYVEKGDTGEIEVRVDNVADLAAFELQLSYDPSILSNVQVLPGDVFEGWGSETLRNTVDPATGRIHYIVALHGKVVQGATGPSFSLARIRFVGANLGVSPMDFVSVQLLSSREGISLEPETENGEVHVVWRIPGPTPTPTIRRTRTTVPTDSTPTSTSTSVAPPTPTATWTSTGTVTPQTATPTWTPRPPTPTPMVPTQTMPITGTIWFQPAIQSVALGGQGWVDIMIGNAPGLYGAWVNVRYGRCLEVFSIQPGSLFAGRTWAVVANQIDPIARKFTYAASTSTSELNGVSGGQLARVHFFGVYPSLCDLTFEVVVLSNVDGVAYAVEIINGAVNVGGVPVPTATPTPVQPVATPTHTPTPRPLPSILLELPPEAANLPVGGEAEVLVKVQQVLGLNGVDFQIDFAPAVLEVLDADPATPGTQIAVGDMLAPNVVMANAVNNAAGNLRFAIAQSPVAPQSGDGLVARFRVRGKAQGVTPLSLHSTRLLDSLGRNMAHKAYSGFVGVDSRVVIGRAYLESRNEHQGSTITRMGPALATTAGDGSFAFASPVGEGETLQVRASHPGFLSAVKSVIVPADPLVDLGEMTLLAGDLIGPQITVARAAGCPGDATVAMPGPPDGQITVQDMNFVAANFGLAAGMPGWEPSPDGCHPEWIGWRADVNGDGQVNIYDVAPVAKNLGKRAP